MQEIGSEFWDVPIAAEENHFFPEKNLYFLSGRTALQYVIQNIKAEYRLRNVAIPSWCCESIIVPFLDERIQTVFYPVYMQEGSLAADVYGVLDCDAILIMDYFGHIMNWQLSGYKGIVIRDLTHSVFSKVYDDADYFFGSLRKWCGFWTGGFAWCREGWHTDVRIRELYGDYVKLREKAMSGKADYIHGKSNTKEYLSWFSAAENMLEESFEIQYAAERDIDLIKKLNVKWIKSARKKNAERLLGALSDLAIFPAPGEEDCPLFVPILVPEGKRDELHQYLIQKKIYCPVHWPLSQFHHVTKKTRELYENGLSIVCDQRYSQADMDRICEAIWAYLER